jgi:hypothetical protein
MTGKLILAAVTSALFLSASVGEAVAAVPAIKPTKAQLETAAIRLRVLLSAMESKNVEAGAKDALFGCFYEHSLAEISAAMDKAIAANPKVKVDQSNPSQQLAVMVGVCGYKPVKSPPAGGR